MEFAQTIATVEVKFYTTQTVKVNINNAIAIAKPEKKHK